MTFADKMRYSMSIGVKSPTIGMTALNREHISGAHFVSLFLCNHLPAFFGLDGWRMPSGMAALSCCPVTSTYLALFYLRSDRALKCRKSINERYLYV